MNLSKIIILSIGILIFFQFSYAGIPLKDPKISKQEARQMYEEMKRKKEEIAQKLAEKKQQKILQKKLPHKPIMPPKPTTKKEKLPVKKEIIEKPTPTIEEDKIKGRIPGVVTIEKEVEKAKKLEKREKIAQEFKHKRVISFILVFVVILATIIFLIRSMYKGRVKDEEKKK